jgi:hypothetical protein
MLVAIYLFRESTYQVLTLLAPFAFVEFLHIKYEKVFLSQEYYLIFLVLSLLCILYKAQTIRNQPALKLVVGLVAILQLYTGYLFLHDSTVGEERTFITMLLNRTPITEQDENHQLANYINHLPADTHILVDDANAYPVVAYTDNVHKLTLPYQSVFLSAIEAPDKYDDYILLASDKNQTTGYTQLNNKYLPVIKNTNSGLRFHRVYETNDWILYKIF